MGPPCCKAPPVPKKRPRGRLKKNIGRVAGRHTSANNASNTNHSNVAVLELPDQGPLALGLCRAVQGLGISLDVSLLFFLLDHGRKGWKGIVPIGAEEEFYRRRLGVWYSLL